MLKSAGCQDIEIDYGSKTATCKVPADVPVEKVTGSVKGRFSATVKQ